MVVSLMRAVKLYFCLSNGLSELLLAAMHEQQVFSSFWEIEKNKRGVVSTFGYFIGGGFQKVSAIYELKYVCKIASNVF